MSAECSVMDYHTASLELNFGTFFASLELNFGNPVLLQRRREKTPGWMWTDAVYISWASWMDVDRCSLYLLDLLPRMDVDRCSLYLLGLLDGCGQMQSISPGSPAPDGCGQMQSISPGPLGWIWTDAVYIYSTDYNSTEERRMRMIKYKDLATPEGVVRPCALGQHSSVACIGGRTWAPPD